jgi:Spy/CpxP family protein refolding chaperone
MYPGMMAWLTHGHRHGGHGHGRPGHEGESPFEARAEASCGPEEGRHGGRGHGWRRHRIEEAFAAHEDGHFGGFGVRRPLRFLAFKLELEEKQVEELASILNDLKTERAQAEVDNRRSTSGIAEAIAGETIDAAKLTAATDDRVKSAERLRDAVVKAVGRIHKMLTAEQRTRFAYLIRTGVLSI